MFGGFFGDFGEALGGAFHGSGIVRQRLQNGLNVMVKGGYRLQHPAFAQFSFLVGFCLVLLQLEAVLILLVQDGNSGCHVANLVSASAIGDLLYFFIPAIAASTSVMTGSGFIMRLPAKKAKLTMRVPTTADERIRLLVTSPMMACTRSFWMPT